LALIFNGDERFAISDNDKPFVNRQLRIDNRKSVKGIFMNTKSHEMLVQVMCGIALVTMLLVSTTTAQAQRRATSSSVRGIELSGLYGWQYGGDFTAYQGEVEIDDTDNFGFGLGFPIPSRPEAMIELSYSRQNTGVNLKTFPQGVHNELFDLAIEYYQIGAMYNRRTGNASPFGGLTLGATRFAPVAASGLAFVSKAGC
jgi:hypothetical protein